jgi:pimeloyl-ACP methyl ester carboxylesterase
MWNPLLALEHRLTFKPDSVSHYPLPAEAQRCTIGAEFGFSLDAFFVRGTSDAVVLFIHGNKFNLTRFAEHYELFRDLGHSFLAFDFPGYGKSPGWPSEETLYATARAAYSHLTHKLGFSAHQIIIHGLSLGAAVGAELLLHHQARCFVAECPFTCSRDMGRYVLPWLPIWLLVPNRFRNDLRFPLLKLPILIFHGERDAITPIEYSRRLHKGCSNATYVALPTAGHNDCIQQGKGALFEILREFTTQESVNDTTKEK